MYFLGVVLLMLVFPAASVIVEALLGPQGTGILLLVGKWFVFWACGVRLLLAGIRQVSRPGFTAEKIFDLDDIKAFPMVREIGFANLSMGTLGLCTLFRPAWLVPAAVVGGLYYGLAGLGHMLRNERNADETVAMLSDVFAFLVLLSAVLFG